MGNFVLLGLLLCYLPGLIEALRFNLLPNATYGSLVSITWEPDTTDDATPYSFNVNLTNTKTQVSIMIIRNVSSLGDANHTLVENNPFKVHGSLLEGMYRFYAINISDGSILTRSDEFPMPPVASSTQPFRGLTSSLKPASTLTGVVETPSSSSSAIRPFPHRTAVGVIVGAVLASVLGTLFLVLVIIALLQRLRTRSFPGQKTPRSPTNENNFTLRPYRDRPYTTGHISQSAGVKPSPRHLVDQSDRSQLESSQVAAQGSMSSTSPQPFAWAPSLPDDPPPRYETTVLEDNPQPRHIANNY